MSCAVLDNCAVCYGILFLSLFRVGSASSYQWRCSALDTTNNKYYLPDFGGRAQVFGYTWEQSNDGVSYIYKVDNEELDCNGTVTAVEFCYIPPQRNSPDNRQVFTLLTLTQEGNDTRVTNSIPISFNSNSQQCLESKCCDIMTLRESNQFNIPSSNFFLGMTTRSSPNLPGLPFNMYPRFQPPSSYQLAAGQPMVNSIVTLNSPLPKTLRLMWLHITPFPETTISMTTQSTSSVNIETAASSSGNITTATDEPSGSSNTLPVSAVIGVVVILIVIIILILLVLIIMCGKKKYYSSKTIGANGIEDPPSLMVATNINEAYSVLNAAKVDDRQPLSVNFERNSIPTKHNVAYESTANEHIYDDCSSSANERIVGVDKSEFQPTEGDAEYTYIDAQPQTSNISIAPQMSAYFN